MKVLICTTGKDTEGIGDWPADRTVFSAIRLHTFDKMVALVDRHEAECKTVRKLREFYEDRPGKLEIREMDVSDFFRCYNAVQEVLNAYNGHEVSFDISGGMKMLSVACVMNAFNHGVPICHYEAGIKTSLPVIRGFSIFEAYTKDQLRIVSAIRGEMTLASLIKVFAKEGLDEEAVKDGLCNLKKPDVGIITSWSERGKTKITLTEKGVYLKELLPKKHSSYYRSTEGSRAP